MASWSDFRPSELIRRLAAGKVDFVVVGGVAVVAHGYGRFTDDLDICYSADAANLQRLGQVLVGLRSRLRGIEEDLPFVPDGRTLRGTQILCLDTPHGGLDLLVNPPGAPRYEALRRRANLIDIDGVKVRVASIDDMLAMKRAAGRPQDLVDVEALEVARKRARGVPRRAPRRAPPR